MSAAQAGGRHQGSPRSLLQYRQGRTRGWGCVRGVQWLCGASVWDSLGNRSMRIQGLYVGTFPRFIRNTCSRWIGMHFMRGWSLWTIVPVKALSVSLSLGPPLWSIVPNNLKALSVSVSLSEQLEIIIILMCIDSINVSVCVNCLFLRSPPSPLPCVCVECLF
jgi:hypothetical protein